MSTAIAARAAEVHRPTIAIAFLVGYREHVAQHIGRFQQQQRMVEVPLLARFKQLQHLAALVRVIVEREVVVPGKDEQRGDCQQQSDRQRCRGEQSAAAGLDRPRRGLEPVLRLQRDRHAVRAASV